MKRSDIPSLLSLPQVPNRGSNTTIRRGASRGRGSVRISSHPYRNANISDPYADEPFNRQGTMPPPLLLPGQNPMSVTYDDISEKSGQRSIQDPYADVPIFGGEENPMNQYQGNSMPCNAQGPFSTYSCYKEHQNDQYDSFHKDKYYHGFDQNPQWGQEPNFDQEVTNNPIRPLMEGLSFEQNNPTIRNNQQANDQYSNVKEYSNFQGQQEMITKSQKPKRLMSGVTPLMNDRNNLPSGNRLSLMECVKNLCTIVNENPEIDNAVDSLEKFTVDKNVCLTSAFIFKSENRDNDKLFKFTCKLYLSGIFIAQADAQCKKVSKARACWRALSVLRNTPFDVIVNTHERIDVSKVGKEEADIIETGVKMNESTHLGANSKTTESEKSIADFFLLEPEYIDVSSGMTPACILRQSADFSHMLIKYDFEPSGSGILCTVTLEGKELSKISASEANKAKSAASDVALQNLRKTNWTIQILKQEKPKPDPNLVTRFTGRIDASQPREHFEMRVAQHLSNLLAGLDDLTKWIPLSDELTKEERDAVYAMAKNVDMRVETKRSDGGRRPNDKNQPGTFLVISKRFSCHDLFNYIWEQGGQTWRYRLKPPLNLNLGSDVFKR